MVALVQKGDLAGAARQAARQMAEKNAPAELLSQMAALDPQGALRVYWSWDLERTQRYGEKRPVSPSLLAVIHLALGDREQAIAAFEASAEERTGWIMPFLRVEPRVDPLRDDPRFIAVLREIERPLSGD